MSRSRFVERALLSALLVAAGAACSASSDDGPTAATGQAVWNPGGDPGGGYISDGKKDIVWKHGWRAGGSNKEIDADRQLSLWHYHSDTYIDMTVVDVDASNLSPITEGDFWGDNSKGLLLCGMTSNDCWAWKMLGSAVIAKAHVGTKGQNWHFAGTYDIDGDGRKDVVWLDETSGVHTWLMNGGQYRQVDSGLGLRVPLGVGALDGVHPYLVEEDHQNVVRAVRITSTGALAPEGEQFVSPSQGAWFPLYGVGDADGDGKADIFWRNRDTGQLGIWLMNGLSARAYPTPGSAPFTWSIAEIADFDGDGRVDVLWRNISTGDVGLWFLNGTGNVRDFASIGHADCAWATANGGGYATIECPAPAPPPPPPPPKCANRGEPVTSAGCCDTAHDEPWGGRCEPKDAPGCGTISAPAAPCCFHRATSCDSGGVCRQSTASGYVCYGSGQPGVCGSTAPMTCKFDCGYGVIASGKYCSYQDALNAAAPGCSVSSCQ